MQSIAAAGLNTSVQHAGRGIIISVPATVVGTWEKLVNCSPVPEATLTKFLPIQKEMWFCPR